MNNEAITQVTKPLISQETVDGTMRGISGVAGYQALGIELLNQPGVAPKVAAVAMIAAGVREQYKGATGNEASTQEWAVNLREHVTSLGQALVTRNADKNTIASRLKKAVGEDLLNTEDKEYRTTLARVMGGSVMVMSGLNLMMQGGTAEFVAGGVISAAGVVEQTFSQKRGMRRATELANARVDKQ